MLNLSSTHFNEISARMRFNLLVFDANYPIRWILCVCVRRKSKTMNLLGTTFEAANFYENIYLSDCDCGCCL